MKRIKRRAFILGSLALFPYLYFESKSVRVKKYSVRIRNLPPEFIGFTILHLSDLHSKEFGDNQKQLIDLVNRQVFDIVALTGDLVYGNDSNMEPAVQLIRHINKPVFFVPGNHEWWAGYPKIRNLLSSLDVNILENTAVKYSRGTSYIWLVGVDDPFTGRDRLGMALENVISNEPRILLAHAPQIYPAAVDNKIELVLVGHTHGGQIRLPFIGAINIPGQGWFPDLDYGLFESGSTTMIINGGLGESYIPLRVNDRPEIVLITFARG